MKSLSFRITLLTACLVYRAAAEDDAEPKSHMKEVLKAKAAEEAKKAPITPARPTPAPVASSADKPISPAAAPFPATSSTNPAQSTPESGGKKESISQDSPAPAKTSDQSPTLLPKVEVKKDRITVLDHQLQEQEKEIAREKKNTKSTETDKAMNDPKVSKALSIFGGESSDYRANIAKERISLMEEEKDLLQAIAFAKTKAEKQELQKQLDEIKALRRDLEKSYK